MPPAVDHQLRAARDTLIDIAADALQRLAADQRPHLGVRPQAVADAQLPCALGQLRHQRLRAVAHQDRHRNGHAALAGRAVRRADQRIDRLLEVRVGHHDHVILGPAERLHALARLGAAPVDVP